VRLERGRQKLRQRLAKFGLPLAATLLLAKTEPVPAALSEATRLAVRGALAGGPVVPAVASLAAGGAFLSRIKIGVAAVLLLFVGGADRGGADRRSEPAVAPPAAGQPAPVRRGVDALGDPLPTGAIARLGTRRHRVQNWPLPWQSLSGGKSYLALQRKVGTDEIRRLDTATGRVLETWRVPGWHRAAGFSPDGRYVLLSTGFDFHIGLRLAGQKEEQEWALTLYDLMKRKSIWEKREKLEEKDWKHVESACFSMDGEWIATTGQYGRGSLRLWDASTGKELWNRKQDVENLEPLGFAGGNATLVLRERNGNGIYLLDRATGKQQRTFQTMGQGETWQCGLAPDGSAVLFGGYHPWVRVWDLTTGKERLPLDGHKQWARRFAFSPDGKTVVTGGNDPFVLVRNWPSGEVVRTINLGRWAIERMAVSSDGRRLEVLFWGEQALHFYDLATGKESPAPREGHQGAVYGVAVAPDGKLLSFSKDSTVLTWDLATDKVVGRLDVEQDLNAGGFALSGDGRLMALPSGDHTAIYVYERVRGKRIRRLAAEQGAAKYLIFSPDGRWLAGTASSGDIIQVWDASDGRSVLQLKQKITYGITCAFSPDGRQFAATGEGIVRLWDVGTWKEQPGLSAYAPLGLAYSPDGRTLAAASVEGVRLFELSTRGERAHVRPQGYPWGVLRFSPTGLWLAWTSGSQQICVWDVHRGELLGPFTGHDDAITGLAFTADDRALVSSSADSTLLVWDIAGAAAKKSSPKPGDVDQAWRALSGKDAQAAYQAIRILSSSPDATIALLARHLHRVDTIDTKRIDACLHALDSDKFEQRERATRELEQLGEQAWASLDHFLAGQPSLEARRRAEQILEKVRDMPRNPDQLRELRALEALEWMGGDGARRLIAALAKGAPDARLTRAAKAALGRMCR
jgi:WD40 repeat protein